VIIPLSWGALYCFSRRKLKTAFAAAVVLAICFSCVSFGLFLPSVEKIYSSKGMASLYKKAPLSRKHPPILASKLFVRGVSYYTGGGPVALFVEDPKRAFFTRHPIPAFSSLEDLQKIEKEGFPVYCVLKEREMRFLERMAEEPYAYKVLQKDADKFFVKLERSL